jgi:mRNA-degrading endonuclease RelE of RelBE toxin-antitoxin system
MNVRWTEGFIEDFSELENQIQQEITDKIEKLDNFPQCIERFSGDILRLKSLNIQTAFKPRIKVIGKIKLLKGFSFESV